MGIFYLTGLLLVYMVSGFVFHDFILFRFSGGTVCKMRVYVRSPYKREMGAAEGGCPPQDAGPPPSLSSPVTVRFWVPSRLVWASLGNSSLQGTVSSANL